MSRTPLSRRAMRRGVSLAGAAVLVSAGVGVGVGLGGGVAAADTGTCAASTHLTKKDASTVGVTMTYDKSVTPTAIGVGQTATYNIVVGTTGIGNPYVNKIVDYPPTGFGAPTSATVTAYHVGGGQKAESVTPEPTSDGGYSVAGTGWFVNSGNPVTATFTYKLPSSVTAGQQVTDKGASVNGTVGVSNSMPTLTSCFSTTNPNIGQTVTGSLDNNGLGSSQGGLSSTGSVSDILGDAIAKGIGGMS